MKRALAVTVAFAGAIAIVFAQPVKADPSEDSSLTGWATNATNQILGAVPSPDGWQPRHVCMGIDSINWGECITFPYPT